MKFNPTPLQGLFLIDYASLKDERGSFMRTFCQDSFTKQGIQFHAVQTNLSKSTKKHTLRGLHYQKEPFAEDKLVHCIQGKCFDVVVDLRATSKTFGQWYAVELDAHKPQALYIPAGCAHGFLTLEDNTCLYYQMSNFYNAEAANGVHWQSPMLAIPWPKAHVFISEQDQWWPNFEPGAFEPDAEQDAFLF